MKKYLEINKFINNLEIFRGFCPFFYHKHTSVENSFHFKTFTVISLMYIYSLLMTKNTLKMFSPKT